MANVFKWLYYLPWGDAKGEECGPGPKGFWRVKTERRRLRRFFFFFFVRIKKHFLAFKLTAVSSVFEGSSLFRKGYDPGKNLLWRDNFCGLFSTAGLQSFKLSSSCRKAAVLFPTFHPVIFPSLSPCSLPIFTLLFHSRHLMVGTVQAALLAQSSWLQ